MKLDIWDAELKLAHEWTIASGVKTGGKNAYEVLFVRLTDKDGFSGIGEAAPSSRYKETIQGALCTLRQIDPDELSFDEVAGSMEYLDRGHPGNCAAKAAINIALLDGAARKAGKAIYDYLGLGFAEHKHITSFSIGIDKPEKIHQKALEADVYPILKLKLGSPADRQNLSALREAAPTKTIRVDANEGWTTKEEALDNIEWLAADPHIEFVEQPMPASTPVQDLAWLKERSPLPLFGDESYHFAKDVDLCAQCYHGVNVKLVKTAGVSSAFEALQAARKAGLKTMIGCMIESSVLITAAAHLAELADHLDIDGNLLITNDPYIGATAEHGVLSFAKSPEPFGLRVRERNGA